ncbi:MAG: T9SS type A sorting domain-containing protein [Flavobacteriales bacterium]|jgi:hypothetical protein|nr:T9SS type A sorting domain-containing protein [Flavobacteriales bacterium]
MNRGYTTFLALHLAFGIQAQEYLANDPVWQERSVCAVPSPCIATDSYSYRTAGDSLIAGITWTKVVREGSVSYSWQAAPPVPTGCQGTVAYGTDWYGTYLIRQDGRQLRIWADNMDQLLYDFDLHINDMLPLSWNNWNEDITVIAVDSVLIGTEMRARYELGNSWAQYIVEGVGSTNGLFEPISNFFECGYSLECFGFGDQGYYGVAGPGACDLAMRVGDLPHKAALSISPVPAKDHATLHGTIQGERFTIHDLQGRHVLHGDMHQDETVIDLSALPNGAYALVTERAAVRLIVMH